MEPDPLEPITEEWRAIEAHARADAIGREYNLSQEEFDRAMRLYSPYDIRSRSSDRATRREELLVHLRSGWNYDRVVHDPLNLRAFSSTRTIDFDRPITVERVSPSSQDEYDAVEIIREMIVDSRNSDQYSTWYTRYWSYNIHTDSYQIRVGDTRAVIPRARIHSPLTRATVVERNRDMAFVGSTETERKEASPLTLPYCSCWAEDKVFPKTKRIGFISQCEKCGGQMHGMYRGGDERLASGWINKTAAERLGLPLLKVEYPTQKHSYDPETTLQWVAVEMEEDDS